MPSNTTLRSIALLALLTQSVPAAAADCAKTPQEAWALTQKAAKTRDLGEILGRLSPAGRGSAATNVLGGVVMHLGLITINARIELAEAENTGNAKGLKAAKAALAKAEEKAKGPRREIDTLLTSQAYPTLTELGEYPLESLSTPEVQARFTTGDQIAFVRDAWALLDRLEAAAKARGWEGGSDGVDELAALAVGMGDLTKPLVGLKVTGETASALNDDDARINFRRLAGCWLVDGNEWIQK